MPDVLTSKDFMRETWDDYHSPTTSNFVHRMNGCKSTISGLEEMLDYDRSGLTKMKKSAKALYSSGNMHVSHELLLSENLEKLGTSALQRDDQQEIGAAFIKFSVVTKELSALMKNLMQSLNNIITFPLDSLLKGDLKGVKGDMKKPFDKAAKEYDAKFNKIEKEKKQLAKEAGMMKTEVTGPEVAEDLEKERRSFQLQACEYLIKVNEVKTKKGVDLLQHLIEFYHAQTNYFQDGLKTIEHYKFYVEELISNLSDIKRRQDDEKQRLTELRDALKESIETYKESSSGGAPPAGYSLHQLQGNKAHGCEKAGYLYKKSEGVRKVWQKRRAVIKDGMLSISHADTTKEPVRLNLLTCQVKLIEDQSRRCFDLISSSKNRTYHFQTEDLSSMEEWISVLNNCKEAILMKAFGDGMGGDDHSNVITQRLSELTRTIIAEVRRVPGNNVCCDCTAPDPEWLSVNLGVLICLECCGVHRDMGVHISRTQSIVIDRLGTSQLLLARAVGNKLFNDIMEATLDLESKPTQDSNMEERKSFIRAKYERHRYAIVTCTNDEDRSYDLKAAVLARDLPALLQVYAEGINFMEPLPDQDDGETALHLAIENEQGYTLPFIDFIIQNSNSTQLNRVTRSSGDSVLHYCVRYNQTECMKLLLRIAPHLVNVENRDGLTALDLAKQLGYQLCVDLISHAISGKGELFENVNVEWDLIQDEHLYDTIDYSDDDLDCLQTPDKKSSRLRPGSAIVANESVLSSSAGAGLIRERPASIATSLDGKPVGLTTSLDSRPNSIASSLDSTLSNRSGSSTLHHKGKTGTGSAGTTPHSSIPSFVTLARKKQPAPPPPQPNHTSHTNHTPHHPSHTLGHTRNTSDTAAISRMAPGYASRGGGVSSSGGVSGSGHVRSPSDPPIGSFGAVHHSEISTSSHVKGSSLTGGKLVLPPPPTFSDEPVVRPSATNTTQQRPSQPHTTPAPGPLPRPAPRGPKTNTDIQAEMMRIFDHQLEGLNNGGQITSKSTDSINSVGSTNSTSTHNSAHHQPVPTPRQKRRVARGRRVKAMYDCEADNDDELSFLENEVIVVLREDEEEWWEGYIESEPTRRGLFPVTFVEPVSE